MAKRDNEIKFKQDLICGVDLEYMVNKVLDWAHGIYEQLFKGRKTELIQGKHLSSFSILTSIGRNLHDAGIALDLSEPSQTVKEKNPKKAVIKQEYINAADFAALINGLISNMAKRIAEADRIAGRWLPDEFTMGEIQAYNEVVDIMESTLKERAIEPNDLRRHFETIIKIS